MLEQIKCTYKKMLSPNRKFKYQLNVKIYLRRNVNVSPEITDNISF